MQLKLFRFLCRPPTLPPEQRKPRSAPRSRGRPEGPISEKELRALWIGLRKHFFPHRPDIDEYRVYWSTSKQKRTLASCSLERRAIRVARELNYEEHKYWLSPLLYHEMCHAYLGYSVHSEEGRSRWHGREFRALEKRHPGVIRLDQWIERGGWARAVRSDRAKRAFKKRFRFAS